MNTTYHLLSAQEATNDIIDAIKHTYKSKSITITIEENIVSDELSDVMKSILDQRLQEDEATYFTSEESMQILRSKYGI